MGERGFAERRSGVDREGFNGNTYDGSVSRRSAAYPQRLAREGDNTPTSSPAYQSVTSNSMGNGANVRQSGYIPMTGTQTAENDGDRRMVLPNMPGPWHHTEDQGGSQTFANGQSCVIEEGNRVIMESSSQGQQVQVAVAQMSESPVGQGGGTGRAGRRRNRGRHDYRNDRSQGEGNGSGSFLQGNNVGTRDGGMTVDNGSREVIEQTERHFLKLDCTTWERDSHDLYDYEAKTQINVQCHILPGNAKLIRTGNKVERISDDAILGNDVDLLMVIKYDADNDQYTIAPPTPSARGPNLPAGSTKEKRVWMIVKDLNDKRYILSKNDIIKLGRFKMKVKNILESGCEGDSVPHLDESDLLDIPVVNTDDNTDDTVTHPGNNGLSGTVRDDNLQSKEMRDDKKLQKQSKGEERVCRFCLSDEGEVNDMLICPCLCKGSIKYIHTSCINQWITDKLNLHVPSNTLQWIWTIRPVICELCKSSLPMRIKYNGEIINLVRIPKTKSPYIVFENIPQNVANPKAFHIICPDEEKEVKIGRGHESDLRIADVSISRLHSLIYYKDNKFGVSDVKSKFGTLVALQTPRCIEKGLPLALQVGRSIMRLELITQVQAATHYRVNAINVLNNHNQANTIYLPENGNNNPLINIRTPVNAPTQGSRQGGSSYNNISEGKLIHLNNWIMGNSDKIGTEMAQEASEITKLGGNTWPIL